MAVMAVMTIIAGLANPAAAGKRGNSGCRLSR
jgi:hypothetical protein